MATTSSAIISGTELLREIEARHSGRAVTANEVAGLAPELVGEMTSTPEGVADNLAFLQESATNWLRVNAKNPVGFAAYFDTLSPSIRTKALRTLWRNPGLPLVDLLDKIEPTLTLAEAHEAERWARGLKRG